jgi:deferrochelatase/peroxidase EfeB
VSAGEGPRADTGSQGSPSSRGSRPEGALGGPSERGGLSRRQFLGLSGLGTLTLGLGGAGGFAIGRRHAGEGVAAELMEKSYPLRGAHQQGITTPTQQQMHSAAFDLVTSDREDVIALLADWTLAAERMTMGEPVADPSVSKDAPPVDTGETYGSGPAGLTITFAVGRSLFETEEGEDRFGLADRMPAALRDGIPKMAAENLDPARGGGDLLIQACSEDPMVNLHALHDLTRIAFGRATMRWTQLGYGRTSSTSTSQKTPRNLFGFKDGTSNIKGEEPESVLDEHLWIQPGDDQGSWAAGGTYLCFRKIKMMMEVWDELALGEQERTIGRDKLEGAPLSGGEEFTVPDFSASAIDAKSHVALMHPDNNGGRRMLRRGYNYLEGVDYLGRLDAGLFLIAFVRDPAQGFIPVLSKMSQDLLTECLQHVASSVYLVLPGVGETDEYVGRGLFDA